MNPRVSCADRQTWRAWLESNHDTCTEVWLVFYKKHVNRACVAYRDAVEEAICFGWIDGLKKRINEDRYAYRFTPRRAQSKWSPLNISLAENLIADGKMTDAGLSAFRNRIVYEEDFLEKRGQSDPELPDEFREALSASAAAMKHFLDMAPGYRKQYAGWIGSAKKAETRQKRATEAIRLLEQNKKPGMK